LEDQRNLDPFEDNPTKYEKHLYEHQQALKDLIGGLFFQFRKLDERMSAHENAHTAANRAAMDMPVPLKDDKVN
jgi:hypothetical protein